MSGLNRREFVTTATLSLAWPAVFTCRARAAEPVIVEIENGRLQGVLDSGAVSFKGIPYAADTGGKNRFMAPQPVADWTGVREAIRYGDRCIQPGGGASVTADASRPSFSENCCVLNVYAPAGDANARRPVMLYIHGGGFRGGSGDIDGSNLARFGDVVVVTVNHRLNVFGYVHLGFLDPAFADAGNAGQLDLIAALGWVTRNIRAFGGNPDRVTVFGQSGGGSKIVTLGVMPRAKGLFHRAINMSGSSGFGISGAENRESVTNEFLKVLGIGKADLRRLQEVPADRLLAAHTTAVATLGVDDYRAVVDGRLVAHGPLTREGLAMQESMPLMATMTAHEGTLFLAEPRDVRISADAVKARLKAHYKLDDSKVAAVMEGFRQDDPNRTPWDVLVAASSEALVRHPMRHYAELRAGLRQAPVYLLDFNWLSPSADPIRGIAHGADIPFAFGRPTTDPDLEVARSQMSAFAAFARTGDPNNPRIPEWRPYDTARRTTMVIGRPCRAVDDWRGGDRRTSAMLPLQTTFEARSGPLFQGGV